MCKFIEKVDTDALLYVRRRWGQEGVHITYLKFENLQKMFHLYYSSKTLFPITKSYFFIYVLQKKKKNLKFWLPKSTKEVQCQFGFKPKSWV